jgi:hypothetical protein
MAMTATERERLETLEDTIKRLASLIRGAGSKNQLNRLLVLAQNTVARLEARVATLETRSNTILDLVRKLQ